MTTVPDPEDDYDYDCDAPTLMPQISSSNSTDVNINLTQSTFQNGSSSIQNTVVLGGPQTPISTTQQSQVKKSGLIFTKDAGGETIVHHKIYSHFGKDVTHMVAKN